MSVCGLGPGPECECGGCDDAYAAMQAKTIADQAAEIARLTKEAELQRGTADNMRIQRDDSRATHNGAEVEVARLQDEVARLTPIETAAIALRDCPYPAGEYRRRFTGALWDAIEAKPTQGATG